MKKDNRNAIIIALLITVVFMSVGYAFLSVKIDNESMTTSMATKNYIDVRVKTISSVETVGNAYDVKSLISDDNEVTLYPSFLEKEDSVIYTINIKNYGNSDATLENITIDADSEDIVCSLESLNAGDILYAGESKMFKINVSYSEEGQELSEEIVPEVKVKLEYK